MAIHCRISIGRDGNKDELTQSGTISPGYLVHELQDTETHHRIRTENRKESESMPHLIFATTMHHGS